MKIMMKQKGITLIALVITIVVLLILASITIGALTGENGLIEKALSAKEKSEISNEKEIVEIASTQAMGKSKYGNITKNELQNQLDKSTGKGITGVTEEIEDDVLLAKFLETQRIYEVDKEGNVTYLGEESKLLNQATITASPESNTTPKLVQSIDLTIKTPLSIEDENITLVYSWSKSKEEEPLEETYTKATLTGTKRTRKATATSIDTEEENYYLWVKVIVGSSEITEKFGPYSIKDHTTLVACASETKAESGYLGNTEIVRNEIESVTIATSLGTHTTSELNCWDVSQSQDGRYLAWYEDKDGNGYYEVTIAGEGGVVANSNSSYLFSNIGYNGEDTTVFYGLENLDTGLVNNMQDIFTNCRNVESLDLTTFNTSNVTILFSTFQGCTNLEELNVSNWDTSKVVDMGAQKEWGYGGTFQSCNSLKSLDISKWDTSNVVGMGNMFRGCESLEKIDVSNFDTNNVINMCGMFFECSNLVNLDVSSFDTSNVNSMSRTFGGCSSLTSLDVSNFDTSNVTNMGNMFAGCSSLTSLDISKLNTSNVINMYSMFSGCSALENINVSNFNTSKVTSMQNMFTSCNNLTSLDVSKFDTSNVTTMHRMFCECRSLTSLDVSKFNTGNVTTMSDMFYRCNSLESIDVSNFDTSNVTSIGGMFYECYALINIDLSNFNTSNVTDMVSLFFYCKNLVKLNIHKFNMNNVTEDRAMLAGVPKTVSITTNSDTATWIQEKFPDYTNITIVD